MTKPDDIPQDAWDASERRCEGYGPVAVLLVARAIMAERAACRQVVHNTPEAIKHPAGPLYASGWAHAVIAIREAIRNRGAA